MAWENQTTTNNPPHSGQLIKDDNTLLNAADALEDAVTALETVSGAIDGDELQVDVVGALPAGSNLLGKVGIDQTAPGVTDRVSTAGEAKLLAAAVAALTDGQGATYDARGYAKLTVIAGAGATVTISRVDSLSATEHTTGTENSFTVAASSKTVTDVDWPFFRVSAVGGSARVALT